MMNDGVGPMSMYRDAVQARYGAGAQYEAALHLLYVERYLLATFGEVLREHRLNRPQWSVLTILHLAPSEQIPLGRIAQALDVHGTIITNAVDRLSDLGLAERAVDPQDRRSVFAIITEEGANRADTILRQLSERQFGLGSLNQKDLQALTRILDKLIPMP